MIKKCIKIIMVFILSLYSVNVYAADVNLSYDCFLNYKSLHVPAKASNGEITVYGCEHGLILLEDKNGEVEEIITDCEEDIYYAEYKAGKFTAYSYTYKLTSTDGREWEITPDKDHISFDEAASNAELFDSTAGYTPKQKFKGDTVSDGLNRSAEKIIYTGMDYIKVKEQMTVEYDESGKSNVSRGIGIYQSDNGDTWTFMADVSDFHIFRFDGSLTDGNYFDKLSIEILNTGNEYLVRDTYFDNSSQEHMENLTGINADTTQYKPIYVFDKNFNFVKEVYVDSYVTAFSFIDNTYYATSNKKVTYKSTDLENWEYIGSNISVPLDNGRNKIYRAKIPLVKANKETDETHCYGGAIEWKDGMPDKYIIADDAEIYSITKCKDFYIASNSNYVSIYNGSIAEVIDNNGEIINFRRPYKQSKIMFSYDGIYWASQNLPRGSVVSVAQLPDYLFVNAGSASYKFNYEDIEAVIPQCDIKVELNNQILGFSQPPVIEDGRILVPMRFLFEQMGAEIGWYPETQTATAELDNTSVTFSINNTEASVNGTAVTMDVPAQIIGDRTMVPLRFLSEELGYTVTWDEESRTAVIE